MREHGLNTKTGEKATVVQYEHVEGVNHKRNSFFFACSLTLAQRGGRFLLHARGDQKAGRELKKASALRSAFALKRRLSMTFGYDNLSECIELVATALFTNYPSVTVGVCAGAISRRVLWKNTPGEQSPRNPINLSARRSNYRDSPPLQTTEIWSQYLGDNTVEVSARRQITNAAVVKL